MLYEYSCSDCKKVAEEFRRVSERDDAPVCCGKPMQRVITGYYAHSDMEPYYDEILESHILSRKHRRKVMREKEVYEAYGKGWW